MGGMVPLDGWSTRRSWTAGQGGVLDGPFQKTRHARSIFPKSATDLKTSPAKMVVCNFVASRKKNSSIQAPVTLYGDPSLSVYYISHRLLLILSSPRFLFVI
jgi:hypothetical protein